MINPTIYKLAAKLIDAKRTNHCCGSIEFSNGWKDHRHSELFSAFFKPVGASDVQTWFGLGEVQKNRDHRVIALLLMSEIAKTLNKENTNE